MNTLCEGERLCIESGASIFGNWDLEQREWLTPLAYVLGRFDAPATIVTYLVDRKDTKDVDTRTTDGRT